ncbi:hypothetical protein [Paenibacillus cookii]|uniref:Lipoprotein n=1 Tax=Paenibacillus cookii TaxID=157839 RepID=A0ABQ4M0N7_9BACL|nr:hypothetical protein [Paenibacillus cookii]GIO69084.1 hypothetical protein J21TS3_39050 [Paenibacillus cookii]
MKKTFKISSIVLALAVAVSLSGCGGKQEAQTIAPGTSGEQKDQNTPPEIGIIPGTDLKEGAGHNAGQRQNEDDAGTAGEGVKPPSTDPNSEPVASRPQKSPQAMGDPSSGDSKSAASEDGAAARPGETMLEVTVEGSKEQRPAKLAQAEGYSLYVPEHLSFDPAKHLIYMNIDPRYSVRIEKMPSDYNQDELLLEGKEALKKHGDVRQLHSDDLTGPLKDTELFLLASGTSGTYEYIVKELDGSGFVFHVSMPQGEASEGFGPMAFAALNSIQNEQPDAMP